VLAAPLLERDDSIALPFFLAGAVAICGTRFLETFELLRYEHSRLPRFADPSRVLPESQELPSDDAFFPIRSRRVTIEFPFPSVFSLLLNIARLSYRGSCLLSFLVDGDKVSP